MEEGLSSLSLKECVYICVRYFIGLIRLQEPITTVAKMFHHGPLRPRDIYLEGTWIRGKCAPMCSEVNNAVGHWIGTYSGTNIKQVM